MRQQACDELETLITYAEQSHVGGAKESERLTESIGQSKDLLADPTATTKSLNAQYESLDEMLTRYFKAQMTEEGNCTDKIKNADFVLMSTDGWLGNAPSLESNVGEFFNCDFDMYQMLTGLEDGYYLVCVQGFYRNGAADVAYEKNARGTEELKAMLYGNSAEVPCSRCMTTGKVSAVIIISATTVRKPNPRSTTAKTHTSIICYGSDRRTVETRVEKNE